MVVNVNHVQRTPSHQEMEHAHVSHALLDLKPMQIVIIVLNVLQVSTQMVLQNVRNVLQERSQLEMEHHHVFHAHVVFNPTLKVLLVLLAQLVLTLMERSVTSVH